MATTITLNDTNQAKARLLLTELQRIATLKQNYIAKKKNANIEYYQLQEQKNQILAQLLLTIDKAEVEQLNQESALISLKMADCQYLMQKDFNPIVKPIMFQELAAISTIRADARVEKEQFDQAIEARIQELYAEMDQLRELQDSHEYNKVDGYINVIHSEV